MITLTTDFGYSDPFVGQMKGAILGINPRAVISDITHGIRAHDIREASLAVEDSHRCFPRGAVHVVVVDPGVGSSRRPVILSAGGHFFVGPDNGVFTSIIKSYPGLSAVHITATRYFLKSPGATFHGRDVFAPVAAWLSRGTKPEEFGTPAVGLVTLDLPSASLEEGVLRGEVIHIDAFGNCITNIMTGHLETLPAGGPLSVRIKGMALDVLDHYARAEDGEPHALINSSGRLEIFVNTKSAAGEFGITRGEKVVVVSGPFV